jgi:hypothetical protein
MDCDSQKYKDCHDDGEQGEDCFCDSVGVDNFFQPFSHDSIVASFRH